MLLKSVDKNIALLFLLLNSGDVAIQRINALNLFDALQLLNGLISNEIAGNVKVIHAIDTSSKMIEIAKIKADRRKIENIN